MSVVMFHISGKEVNFEALTIRFGDRIFKIVDYNTASERIELKDIDTKTTIKIPVRSVFFQDTSTFLVKLLEVQPDFFV